MTPTVDQLSTCALAPNREGPGTSPVSCGRLSVEECSDRTVGTRPVTHTFLLTANSDSELKANQETREHWRCKKLVRASRAFAIPRFNKHQTGRLYIAGVSRESFWAEVEFRGFLRKPCVENSNFPRETFSYCTSPANHTVRRGHESSARGTARSCWQPPVGAPAGRSLELRRAYRRRCRPRPPLTHP